MVEALRRGGIEAVVEKAGSRQIAASYDLTEYDFAFPAGVPAAEKMRREQDGSQSYDAFFTPMAVAFWKPIAQMLENEGVAQDQGGYYTLDMEKLLALIEQGKRWKDLEGSEAYPVDKKVLITSTDVRKSNSTAMYLSLASFVANDRDIVQNTSDINNVMELMEDLFLASRSARRCPPTATIWRGKLTRIAACHNLLQLPLLGGLPEPVQVHFDPSRMLNDEAPHLQKGRQCLVSGAIVGLGKHLAPQPLQDVDQENA